MLPPWRSTTPKQPSTPIEAAYGLLFHCGCYTRFMVTLGLDEVGRGCWAGPLVAGAVILTQPIAGLGDSKRLTKRWRERLDTEIKATALDHALGWVQPQEVDLLGLTAAVRLAMQRALQNISSKYDQLIIDGNYNFFPEDERAQAIIKADDCVPAVSAAAIIAKVARDKYMAALARHYPHYGFERHVGYGTAAHRSALQAYGVTDVHRKSYKPVREFLVE